ncbi:MAG: 4Fe-4S binding protein [candidate division WOR-3 bacterium]
MKKFLLQEPTEVVTPGGHRFTLLRHFCKGCRICVEFCPTRTLELDDRFKVKVAYPEKCIACRMCELRCPDLAIFVTKGRVQGAEGSRVGAAGGVLDRQARAMNPQVAGNAKAHGSRQPAKGGS